MASEDLLACLTEGAERLGIQIHETDLSYLDGKETGKETRSLGLASGGNVSIDHRTQGAERAFVLGHELTHEILMHPLRVVPEPKRELQSTWVSGTVARMLGVSLDFWMRGYNVPLREPDDEGESLWAAGMLIAAIKGWPELPYLPDTRWKTDWCRAASLVRMRWSGLVVEARFDGFPYWYRETMGTSAVNHHPWYMTREESLAVITGTMKSVPLPYAS